MVLWIVLKAENESKINMRLEFTENESLIAEEDAKLMEKKRLLMETLKEKSSRAHEISVFHRTKNTTQLWEFYWDRISKQLHRRRKKAIT